MAMFCDAVGYGDPFSVAGLVGVPWCAGRHLVADGARDRAQVVVDQRRVLDQPGQRFDQVDIDQLAIPAENVSVVECHHDCGRGRLRGHTIGKEEGGKCRRTMGLSGHVGEAAHRFGERAEARAVTLGPAGTVPADVEHDEAWVACVHGLEVETHRTNAVGRLFTIRMSLTSRSR